MTNNTGAWHGNPDLVSQLERMVGAGVSFKEIGAALGITKNAAISKAQRMGFRRDEDAPLSAWQLAHLNADKAPRTLHDRLDALGALGAPHGSCAFPIGDVGQPGFRFCGAEASVPPYCDEHRRRAYVGQSLGAVTDERPTIPSLALGNGSEYPHVPAARKPK